mmetsp:Transcript_2499/g.7990  ORF Transcript_2499/g.7990 Transcript_2499/m.7990 type:complete len:477 (+) Transcript_2499:1404-2834(+)
MSDAKDAVRDECGPPCTTRARGSCSSGFVVTKKPWSITSTMPGLGCRLGGGTRARAHPPSRNETRTGTGRSSGDEASSSRWSGAVSPSAMDSAAGTTDRTCCHSQSGVSSRSCPAKWTVARLRQRVAYTATCSPVLGCRTNGRGGSAHVYTPVKWSVASADVQTGVTTDTDPSSSWMRWMARQVLWQALVARVARARTEVPPGSRTAAVRWQVSSVVRRVTVDSSVTRYSQCTRSLRQKTRPSWPSGPGCTRPVTTSSRGPTKTGEVTPSSDASASASSDTAGSTVRRAALAADVGSASDCQVMRKTRGRKKPRSCSPKSSSHTALVHGADPLAGSSAPASRSHTDSTSDGRGSLASATYAADCSSGDQVKEALAVPARDNPCDSLYSAPCAFDTRRRASSTGTSPLTSYTSQMSEIALTASTRALFPWALVDGVGFCVGSNSVPAAWPYRTARMNRRPDGEVDESTAVLSDEIVP